MTVDSSERPHGPNTLQIQSLVASKPNAQYNLGHHRHDNNIQRRRWLGSPKKAWRGGPRYAPDSSHSTRRCGEEISQSLVFIDQSWGLESSRFCTKFGPDQLVLCQLYRPNPTTMVTGGRVMCRKPALLGNNLCYVALIESSWTFIHGSSSAISVKHIPIALFGAAQTIKLVSRPIGRKVQAQITGSYQVVFMEVSR